MSWRAIGRRLSSAAASGAAVAGTSAVFLLGGASPSAAGGGGCQCHAARAPPPPPLPLGRAGTAERLQPFTPTALAGSSVDPADCTFADLGNGKSELARLVAGFVASTPEACSFELELGSRSAAGRARAALRRVHGPVKEEAERSAAASIGLGLFEFEWNGQRLCLLNSAHGTPQVGALLAPA